MWKASGGKLVGICLVLGKFGSYCSLHQNYFNTLQPRQARLQQKCENDQFISCMVPFAPLRLCNACLGAVGKAWFNPQLTEQRATDDKGSLGGKVSFSPTFFFFSKKKQTQERKLVGLIFFHLSTFCYMHFKHFEISVAFHLWIQRTFVWGSKIKNHWLAKPVI